ncbi:double-stranded RNA-binding protein Staufen homolog 2-like [Hydractinia symbiolongicarpus]|uniref:double-stranded RNA-binding protein Staufen homolog 2-like n=1 Tax=Hydractinia symbiolongicarpus TaxID=13093 RepID=UPI00254F07FF|nr:double-stranded RNA-binding protein Staufen homolog 2-like [Hydractinia symbiolongicarpus]
MANSTPSSVLNELAKSNKVTAHYKVVSETGPAHQKLYKVHLHIGGHGPFEGAGSSLKNARNAAASRALMEGAPGLHVNPTVELNILSMKSGQTATYRELDSVSLPPRPEYESLFVSQQYHHGVLQRPSRMSQKFRRLWRMSVTICERAYIGEGHTKSEARGNAASHALQELRPLLLEQAKMMEIERAQQQQSTVQLGKDNTMAVINPPSFVADLYELANRHRMEVSFETVNETGPAHVKKFYIKCITGSKQVLGRGIGKKAAKNDAAEKMLALLQNLPPPEPKKGPKGQRHGKKKTEKLDNGIDPSHDAVTYLTQLLQLRKEPAPVFTLISDAGPHQKGLMRYHIEASVEEHKAAGYGVTKKAAKLNSATNLLKSFGIDLEEQRKAHGVTEKKSEENGTELLNLAIDVLKSDKTMLNRAPGSPVTQKITVNNSDLSQAFPTAKQKLDYVARLEGFQVMYNDFVKDKLGEFSSHLAVYTTPPEVFQGIGETVDASREDAASKALQAMVVSETKTEGSGI